MIAVAKKAAKIAASDDSGSRGQRKGQIDKATLPKAIQMLESLLADARSAKEMFDQAGLTAVDIDGAGLFKRGTDHVGNYLDNVTKALKRILRHR